MSKAVFETIAKEVVAEATKAEEWFPVWPTDPIHALGILGEEFGELNKEVVQMVYEPHKTSPEALKKEAVQCAAMAIRFLASLELYRFQKSEQHVQPQ